MNHQTHNNYINWARPQQERRSKSGIHIFTKKKKKTHGFLQENMNSLDYNEIKKQITVKLEQKCIMCR